MTWDALAYDQRHSYIWEHGAGVVEALAPKSGERILDIGCGTGHLTARIAEAGAEVIGIDSSPGMVEQARKNYPSLHFQEADARNFSFAKPFDAVFSNAVLHWIHEQEEVVRCVWRALRPGGRFVAEFGGRGNISRIILAIQSAVADLGYEAGYPPWYYPSLAEYATLLENQGFIVRQAAYFDRPTALDGGADGIGNWLRMFAGEMLKPLPPDLLDRMRAGVEARLRPHLYRDGVWYADYVRLRVAAQRP